MFEKALKEGYRYTSSKGLITTEDLWNLPLKSSNGFCLNSVAKAISASMKEIESEDFVSGTTKSNSLLEARMEIVKHIIKVKLEDRELANSAKERKDRKEYLLSLKKDKELAVDNEKSIEEIEKELALLG